MISVEIVVGGIPAKRDMLHRVDGIIHYTSPYLGRESQALSSIDAVSKRIIGPSA